MISVLDLHAGLHGVAKLNDILYSQMHAITSENSDAYLRHFIAKLVLCNPAHYA